MYKIPVSLFFILLLPLVTQAQKIKYKELITLLNTRQFEKAEPFLKRYVKETTDNPNAYLFMGMIFFEKATNNDILKNTDQTLSQCDSAILFFDKAYSMVTEKELKRNDEYYQMYSRRDLRTGEFGIKLSDVRLDLENRTTSLKERKERIKVAKKNLVTCERLYKETVEQFVNIRLDFASDKQLLLRSDETMAVKLSKLTAYFDSTMLSVNLFKSALKQVGKTTYSPTISIQEINDISKDGSTNANFLESDIKLWNYKKWAASLSEKVKNEIIPIREGLIAFDISLNKLRDKCVRDSVPVYTELGSLSDNVLVTQLKKYIDDPLPIAIFNMKKAELEYLSDKIRLKPLQDSLDITIRLNTIKTELTGLKKIDSITTLILKRDIDNELLNFQDFVTKAFGTKDVIISQVRSMQDFAKRERLKKEVAWEATMQSKKWIISGMDSVPIFTETNRELPYKPLTIMEEKYTVGLLYKDSLATGYVYTITPSRIPDLKVTFSIDQLNFTRRSLPSIKNMNLSVGQGQIYFVLIYSEVKVKDKVPATLAKIYKTDGLAWAINYKFDSLPSELSYSATTGILSIQLTQPTGETKTIQIDKNGKLM
jgi:hypothetical protein